MGFLLHSSFLPFPSCFIIFLHLEGRKRAKEKGRERERAKGSESLLPIRGQSKSFRKLSLEIKLNVFLLPGIRKESGKSTAPKSAILFQTYNLWILTYFRKPTDIQTGGGFPERGGKGALSKRLTFLAKHRRKKKPRRKKNYCGNQRRLILLSQTFLKALCFFALQLHQTSKKIRHFLYSMFFGRTIAKTISAAKKVLFLIFVTFQPSIDTLFVRKRRTDLVDGQKNIKKYIFY